jgi:hypothetical protein
MERCHFFLFVVRLRGVLLRAKQIRRRRTMHDSLSRDLERRFVK